MPCNMVSVMNLHPRCISTCRPHRLLANTAMLIRLTSNVLRSAADHSVIQISATRKFGQVSLSKHSGTTHSRRIDTTMYLEPEVFREGHLSDLGVACAGAYAP